MKLLIDGDPYAVIENEYVKPGKGQAFNRIKVRNLKTGRVIERTLTSLDEASATADLVVNCTGLGSRKLAHDRELVRTSI